MSRQATRLGMVLKGYPRISESFISTEILLLESLGIPIEIYSLRLPRETFSHEHVRKIRARATYLPEYVIPNWRMLLKSNFRLWRLIGARYRLCLGNAIKRAYHRKRMATIRHFLQAGHLCATRLHYSQVGHLHAHFCHTPTSVTLFASQLMQIPFSFTAHAKDIYTSEPEQLLRKMRAARFVVTCTKYNALYLSELARYAQCPTPIHTIYHGIDLDLFGFGHLPPIGPPYRILSVGRLVAKKGYDDLLHALAILDRSGLQFEFVHIGSGELEPKIRRLIQSLGLSQKVQLLGSLPHTEVIEHYRRAHCFVLACKIASNGDRDGIPNVLVEAMAIGLPVIATAVSAIPELVEDGVTGTLADSGNPASIASALYNVLRDPMKYKNMAKRARGRIEAHFDNRMCIRRLYHLFNLSLQNR